MPSPTDYYDATQVAARGYLIEESVQDIFATDPNGNCGTQSPVTVVGDRELCIFWQQSSRPVPYRELLRALDWLVRYVRYGTRLMGSTPDRYPVKTYTGADGLRRRWIIEANEELCWGYGGAAYNGQSWCAISQDNLAKLLETVDQPQPTMPQVIFYEMGRALWNLPLDQILDWELDEPNRYGFWTLGWNGAMTVLAPEHLGAQMDYYGQDAAGFRADRLRDLETYVRGRRYNFGNTWCSYLLPWNERQSVNDLMSGLLIYLYEQYGGDLWMVEMWSQLRQQPDTFTRQERERRAENLVRACYLATFAISGRSRAEALHRYFYVTLRWTFLGSRPDQMFAKLV